MYLPKIASFINFKLPIEIFKKSTLSDMRHLKTYMYVNFQQNRVNISVKSVQKIANCTNLQLAIRISKNNAFQTCTTP